jgi:hypothetical protein
VPHWIRDGADLPVPCNRDGREAVPTEIQDQRAHTEGTGLSRPGSDAHVHTNEQMGLRPLLSQ